MKNLIIYSFHEQLNRYNKVIIVFIEILVQNIQSTNILSQEKLFKTTIAIDSIYDA